MAIYSLNSGPKRTGVGDAVLRVVILVVICDCDRGRAEPVY